MQGRPTLKIIIDERRALSSGLFPVKLCVTFRMRDVGKKSRWERLYYGLDEASLTDFHAASTTPRSTEQKALASTIAKSRKKAEGILEAHEILSPTLFDRLFSGAGGSGVLGAFERYIAELREFGQVGTATNYATAMRSLKAYAGRDFSFQELSPDWLRRYEKWMKGHKVKRVIRGQEKEIQVSAAVATIAIYLRCLRKIFNDAITDKWVSADYYPFGRKRFLIQSVRSPKQALSKEQKNAVLEYKGPEQEAVDFWIFSYFCNGMNLSDIARLRHRDIDKRNQVILLNRVKTITTARTLRKIEIHLRPEVQDIIRRHGNKSLNPAGYVFPVLEAGLTPQQEKNRIHDFIDRTNQGLRRAAVTLGFDFKFTTYTARHTFATISVREGASKALIQEALGHSSMQTTENYLAGFDRETKRKMSERL